MSTTLMGSKLTKRVNAIISDSSLFKDRKLSDRLSVIFNASKVGIDVDRVIKPSRFTTVNLEVKGGKRPLGTLKQIQTS
ncbi:hypothetical protein QJS10_CPB14g01671 [Acorus calamus]|uniref:Uncharacterized protein n=1 Tax=Acorus calamus TaxID=4465 RepID=A0AAV9DET8_ACOCL|nr:hypothetical protein QJS10_CPB14g01671 [Acorus calamus]